MAKPYSYDFRQKVIDAIELDGRKKCEVSEIFNISRNTIDLWLKRKAQTGDLKPKPNKPPGNNHKITDWAKFRDFARTHGDKNPGTDGGDLGGGHKFKDDLPCLASYWVHAKKKTYGYMERDEAKRQAFLEQLATIDPSNIVYADEAGMDNRDDYGYGWNKRGERFHALKVGQRPWRVNMIAAYCNRQLFAPFTIVGACNRIVFETWIEKCLMAALKPGQWLVIDNATFHKGGRIEALLEQVGCKVLYLPPYSPDLNKIENCWSWLKSRIRHCKSEFDCLRDAMEYVLKLLSS